MREKEVKPWIGEGGYSYVTLINKEGVKEDVRLDITVAKAFPDICGEYSEGKTLRHKDGDKQNNRADNLEWV